MQARLIKGIQKPRPEFETVGACFFGGHAGLRDRLCLELRLGEGNFCGDFCAKRANEARRSQTSILRVVSTASPLSISSLEACATFHSTDDRARPGCQTFAAERCKLLLITSTQISSIHPQYGPSLRTRIVIISRHVRSRGVDELKMLLLMPQKFNIPTLKIRCLLETFG